MKKLKAAVVWRAGRTARSWNHETNKVELDTEKELLQFKFSLTSKGGGITDVRLTIGADDFAPLALAMLTADRSRAMQETSAALAAELTKQTEFDAATIRKARESVVEAAEKAYTEAPAGRDHAERLTRDVVRQLVEQLDEQDRADSTEDSAA